jgi:ABC-type branched-subunit amino acid transport system ATPase component
MLHSGVFPDLNEYDNLMIGGSLIEDKSRLNSEIKEVINTFPKLK